MVLLVPWVLYYRHWENPTSLFHHIIPLSIKVTSKAISEVNIEEFSWAKSLLAYGNEHIEAKACKLVYCNTDGSYDGM